MGFITSGGEVEISIVGRLEGLNRAVDEAEKMMGSRFGNISRTTGAAMTGMGAAITGALGFAVNAAADFEQELRNAVSVTGETGAAADATQAKMEALAVTLGQKTAFSATEVARAMYDLNSKGFRAAEMSVEELLPFLDLASATQSDLTMTTELLTSTIRAFGFENGEAARVADVFARSIGDSAAKAESFSQSLPIVGAAARATGVDFEETAAALSVLYDNGVTASTAATGLRNIMIDLTNGSKPLETALAANGLSMEDLDLKGMGLGGTLMLLRENGMSSTEMMAAFGKENAAIASLLLQNTEKLLDFDDNLQKAGGTARQMADMQLQSLSGQLTILYGSLETVAVGVGQQLIPMLTKAATDLIPMVNNTLSWIKANEDLARNLVIAVGAFGLFNLTIGPLVYTLPQIVGALTMMKLAFTGLPGAATGAAGAVNALGAAGTASKVGIAAATGGVVAWGIALTALGYLIYKIIGAHVELKQAQDQEAESKRSLDIAERTYIETLKEKGVVLDQQKMKEMGWRERTLYMQQMESFQEDQFTRAYLQQLLGRQETEEEYGRARNLRLNQYITAEEAAFAVSQHLSDAKMQALMTADEETTQALLQEIGARRWAEDENGRMTVQSAVNIKTQVSQQILDAARERTLAWNESAREMVATDEQAAGRIGSIWQRLLAFFGIGDGGGGPQAPGPTGYEQGGVVGLPGYGTGGRIGRDLEAFRWNEAGGEIAVAPVGTRILNHGESVAVARDAVREAMAGMGVGGGGAGSVTINIDRPVVRSDEDLAEIARGVERALDAAWSRRVGFGRV